MKHEWTADLLTYWDRLRNNRAAPTRQDIQPRDLGSKLPHVFVLHPLCSAPDRASSIALSHDTVLNDPVTQPAPMLEWQFRLAGTRICSFYNRELRDTRFLSLWRETTRPWLMDHMTQSAFDCRPLRLEHVGHTLSERQCRFETILLPLKETDGSIGWLGSTLALETPLWLGSDPLIHNDLGSDNSKSFAELTANNKSTSLKSILEALLERYKSSNHKAEKPSENLTLPATNSAIATHAMTEIKQPNAKVTTANSKHPPAPTSQPPTATISIPTNKRPLTPRAASLLAQLNRTTSPATSSQSSTKPHPVIPDNIRRLGHLTLIPGGKKH